MNALEDQRLDDRGNLEMKLITKQIFADVHKGPFWLTQDWQSTVVAGLWIQPTVDSVQDAIVRGIEPESSFFSAGAGQR